MGKRGKSAKEQYAATSGAADKYTAEHVRNVVDVHRDGDLRLQEIHGRETAAVLDITKPIAEVNDHDPLSGDTVRQKLVGIIAGEKGTYCVVHASVPQPGITMARHETLLVTNPDTLEMDENNGEVDLRSSSLVFSEEGFKGIMAVDVSGDERFVVQYDAGVSESQVTIYGDEAAQLVVAGADVAKQNIDLSDEFGTYWAASPTALREYTSDIYMPTRIV